MYKLILQIFLEENSRTQLSLLESQKWESINGGAEVILAELVVLGVLSILSA
ncbi:MAG: hypothetical protein ACYTXI_41905 [Nostoc sp.]